MSIRVTAPRLQGSDEARVLAAIAESGVLVVARLSDARLCDAAADATRAAGIRAFEVTVDTPGALEWIRAARESRDDLVIGAGTITTVDEARAAIDAGAQFVVSPFLDLDVLAYGRQRGVLSLPGTFTTTEIAQALRAGAPAVKLFPATTADPTYIRQVTAPLRNARLIPTGGIDAGSASAYIEAGAFAVGVGGAILRTDLLERSDIEGLRSALQLVVGAVAKGRGR